MMPIELILLIADPVNLALQVEAPIQLEATNIVTPEVELDPVFLASEAGKFVAGDKARLDDALVATARLGEFDTAQKKVDARQNLELQIIDLGTF